MMETMTMPDSKAWPWIAGAVVLGLGLGGVLTALRSKPCGCHDNEQSAADHVDG